MIPKRVNTRQGTEYACGKCGKLVGYYTITGSGEDDWRFARDKFCHNCGEKVEWLESKEDRFPVYTMIRYGCGHFEFKKEYIVCHPEEHKETQCVMRLDNDCPMCNARIEMRRAENSFQMKRDEYFRYKSIQDRGENFFTSVTDEKRDEMFRRMKKNDD